MSLLSEFAVKFGIPAETVEMLAKGELPDGMEVDALVEKQRKNLHTLFEAQSDKKFTKEDLDKQFGVYKKTVSASLNKTFGLGLSRNEAEEIDPAEMQKKIFDHYQSLIEEAQTKAGVKSDATTKELIKNLEEDRNKWQTEYQALEQAKDAEIAKAYGEADKKIRQMKAEQIFDNEWNKRDFPAHLKPVEDDVKKSIRDTIFSRYDSDENGNLMSKDGGQAINFDENGVWDSIKQPMDYLWKMKKIEPLSNGGGSDDPNNAGSAQVVALTGRAKEMRERAMAAQKK